MSRPSSAFSFHSYSQISSLMLTLMCTHSCIESPREQVIIDSVTPVLLAPGEEAVITGRGFGARANNQNDQVASIAGRPLLINAWTDTQINATLPLNLTGGERLLTLSRLGQPIVTKEVYVDAPLGEPLDGSSSPPPPVGPGPAAGTSPDERLDMGLDRGLDMERDATVSTEFSASFTPNTEGADVTLQTSIMQGRDDSLVLQITIVLSSSLQQRAWGVAGHLRFPTDRLRYQGLLEYPSDTLNAVVSEQLPDRVMFYRVNTGVEVMTLRFEILDPSESLEMSPPFTIDFVPRMSGLRDLSKQPTSAVWSGGSVRYVTQ